MIICFLSKRLFLECRTEPQPIRSAVPAIISRYYPLLINEVLKRFVQFSVSFAARITIMNPNGHSEAKVQKKTVQSKLKILPFTACCNSESVVHHYH